jgi:hypothetical protein
LLITSLGNLKRVRKKKALSKVLWASVFMLSAGVWGFVSCLSRLPRIIPRY